MAVSFYTSILLFLQTYHTLSITYTIKKASHCCTFRFHARTFFNTETGKTYIFDEYSGSARSATDDGIGFIVNSGGASGYVVDIESGTQLGTTEQWIYDNYGITVPAGYIQRLCPNGMVLGYSVMNVGPGNLSVAWYVRPTEM